MLQVSDLAAGYGDRPILHDISFSVKRGEMISVIGPNGCGKTTLFRALSKLINPIKGRIRLGGDDIVSLRRGDLARKQAVVSQELFSGEMSVEEYVLLGRIPHFGRLQMVESAEDMSVAQKYMRLTGVDAYRSKPMAKISGGERQLAVITRALIQEPELLLLDEPTSHLDIRHQVGLLDLIRKLNRQYGITVLMIVHDLNLASEYSDGLILMSKGRVYSQGAPEHVLTYKALEEVYETIVIVEKNPISKKPFILLASEQVRTSSTAA
jgi:iron complex transport system ATP-binding protein